MRGRRTGIVLLALVALAGCGGSSSGDSGLTAGQRRALLAQLEAVRTAASARDAAATNAAIDRFRGAVVRLRRAGALTNQQARALRIGAARVAARFRSDNAARAAPPQPVPAAPGPSPPPPKHEKKPGHGKGHDKQNSEGDE